MNAKEIIQIFYENGNEELAEPMAKYMRNRFEFLGIKSPKRKEISKEFIKEAKKTKRIDWGFVEKLWTLTEREFQYLACDYLRAMKKFLVEEDLEKLKDLVITKSWWDTVDSLDQTIGSINFPSDYIDEEMLKWSEDENFWLRRVAINHQRPRKDKTNTILLEKILKNNLNQTEFFINKAMGWALREYSKTDSKWVFDFILENKEGLSNLTIREASKYLD
ncbi:DNA alkylation repair protein [Helcococcus kunzii]